MILVTSAIHASVRSGHFPTVPSIAAMPAAKSSFHLLNFLEYAMKAYTLTAVLAGSGSVNVWGLGGG